MSVTPLRGKFRFWWADGEMVRWWEYLGSNLDYYSLEDGETERYY